jgi:hypothetical protein
MREMSYKTLRSLSTHSLSLSPNASSSNAISTSPSAQDGSHPTLHLSAIPLTLSSSSPSSSLSSIFVPIYSSWDQFFHHGCGIPTEDAVNYSSRLQNVPFDLQKVKTFDYYFLMKLGISNIDHQLAIMSHVQQLKTVELEHLIESKLNKLIESITERGGDVVTLPSVSSRTQLINSHQNGHHKNKNTNTPVSEREKTQQNDPSF